MVIITIAAGRRKVHISRILPVWQQVPGDKRRPPFGGLLCDPHGPAKMAQGMAVLPVSVICTLFTNVFAQ